MDTVIHILPWVFGFLIVFMISRPASPFGAFLRLTATNITHHGSKNAVAYTIGGCLVIGAGLMGVYDNFSGITPEQWQKLGWWQITSLACKSLSAAPLALVGYLIKSPLTSNNETPPK